MEKLFNIILILCALYFLNQYFKKDKSTFENTFFNKDMEKKLESHKVVPTEIEFNYNLRNIDKQFLKEQEKGVVMNTIHHALSEDNKVIPFDYVENRTSKSHAFNESRIKNLDGVMNTNTVGKSIREIYDESLIDYKNLIPSKKQTVVDDTNMSRDAASDLSYITNDMWLYDNEKQENGGEIKDGLFAYDNSANNSVAIY